MDISFRRATPGDYVIMESFLYDIRLFHWRGRVDLFSEPARPVIERGEYEKMAADENYFLVIAESGEGPAGFINSKVEEHPPGTAMAKPRYLKINDVFVKEDMRGRGIGRALLEKSYEWGKEKGVTHAVLFVWTFNENAVGFYEKMGYGKNTIVMARSLE